MPGSRDDTPLGTCGGILIQRYPKIGRVDGHDRERSEGQHPGTMLTVERAGKIEGKFRRLYPHLSRPDKHPPKDSIDTLEQEWAAEDDGFLGEWAIMRAFDRGGISRTPISQ